MLKICNLDSYKLADDIKRTKGVIINYSDFKIFTESNNNDENIDFITEVESVLKKFAYYYDIDYDNDDYLEECYNWYINNIDIINEGKIFNSLKEFLKKIVAGIINFFKKIIEFIKNIFRKLKSLFSKNKESNKDTNNYSIKTKLIDIDSVEVVEVISNSYEDLYNHAKNMCSKITDRINSFNKKQQDQMNKIKKDIEYLSRVENSITESYNYFDLVDSIDLLEMVDLISKLEL